MYKYFKIGIDGVKAESKEEALKIYNEHHDSKETEAKEVKGSLEVSIWGGNHPQDMLDDLSDDDISVSDVFSYARPEVIIEELFI